MKGDFSRIRFDPRKGYTRVLKQQGRVDLDADWNEAVEILTHRDRTEAIDVIGRCGVPIHGGGFKVETTGDQLTITPGRIWVDGILYELDGEDPVPLTEQDDLPGYALPDEDGVYLVYVDVWERHITHLEDPEIREPALGGPDTTTRTRTVGQVRLHRMGDDEPLAFHECEAFPADPGDGRLAADHASVSPPTNPCAVPEGAGYTGLENRLYRVEIHDDGRDEDGTPGARPVTWKWSRDNGSVVLPVAAENGIDGDTVTLQRLGFDEVLTVKVGDWVEVLGDETELWGRPGTLGQIVPEGIDRADLEVELDTDVSAHAAEGHLKMRRWDHQATEELELVDGALPIPTGPFELEDGVIVEFEAGGTYRTGDYWVIPARTREGTVLWPREGEPAVPLRLRPLGITHHHCTLALARRSGGEWLEPRDCRPLFPPLTEVKGGGCCLTVDPGEDIQQALDTVVAAGGGCVTLCPGVHVVAGSLRIQDGADVTLHGVGSATTLRFVGEEEDGVGGLFIRGGQRVSVEDLFVVSERAKALITIGPGAESGQSRRIALRRLLMLNRTRSDGKTDVACGVRLGDVDGIVFEECRIAAEAGVVSLWGDSLPIPPARQDEAATAATEEETTAWDVLELGFEELEADAEFKVGESFTESDVTVIAEPFENELEEMDPEGFARVDDAGIAGGSGQDLHLSSINLAFQLPATFETALVTFGEAGGNVNLRVNDEHRNVGSLAELDGEVVGGVRVTVAAADFSMTAFVREGRGRMLLEADTRRIESVALGGAELWIDDVVFRGGEGGDWASAYGEGVRDLALRDTAIRFGEVGILAARAAGWQLDRADIQPVDPELWTGFDEAAELSGALRDPDDFSPPEARETASASRVRSSALLGALEEVFAAPASGRGVGILAFRWEGCHLRDCVIAGRHGVHAFWWLGGGATRNQLAVAESGLHAFWLYRADWEGNTVDAGQGLGLSVAGCCRARLNRNRVNGPVGVANLPMDTALEGLVRLGMALLRGYGTETGVGEEILLGIFVDESMELMGFGPLMDALQPLADEVSPVPGAPAAWVMADSFLGGLRGRDLPLPLVDLELRGNEVVSVKECVAFRDYLPLGGLRIAGNRLHTTAGKALRVETNPYLANAHLVVRILRLLLDRAGPVLGELAAEAEAPLDALWGAMVDLFEGWRSGAERLFDLDFRIEGNTIRSARTAIESNLFELSVLTNHVTLQERSWALQPRGATGTIFGVVTAPDGQPIDEAVVRVVGTERGATNDAKTGYEIAGVPAGSHELQVTRAGFVGETVRADVGVGEQVEVNVVLRPRQAWAPTEGSRGRMRRESTGPRAYGEWRGFGDEVVAASAIPVVAANAEARAVLDALETSSALEPLAVALREGASTPPRALAGYLAEENGPLASPEVRAQAAAAVALVGGQSSDPELQQSAGALQGALQTNDQDRLEALWVRFIQALLRFTDSQGILLGGLGGRVVENQVIVPSDARGDTEALGGIQVSVQGVYVTILSWLGALLVTYLTGTDETDDQDVELDPLLGITDTLIDTNEVIGGVGHGISVQGMAGRPDFVSDLHVRGNQVRGMAGAGVLINEHALVVGLDLAGNRITGCGRDAGFTRSKGGVLIQTAALCDIRGNHVSRCGVQLDGANAYGFDLDAIYGLRFVDNAVQANGTAAATAEDGGARLVEVYGATQLHDNVVAFNRGLGLSWVNSARQGKEGLLPPFLMAAVNLYLRTARDVGQLWEEEQASIQQNVFKSVADSDLPLFQLLNLKEVLFSGNSGQATTTGSPLGEIQETARGMVSNNQFQTSGEIAIAIKKMRDGVVLGNVGNKPIQLRSSAGVERGYNVPPVT